MDAIAATASVPSRSVGAALVVVALAFADTAAAAQARFPNRPITLVVGSSPGGGMDQHARLLAMMLSEYFLQPVRVEYRPGADSRIGTSVVAHSAADGYTLLIATGTTTIDIAFDPQVKPNVLRDMTPVSMISISQLVLAANASLPVQSVQDMVARVRAMPGKLNYSTPGARSTLHLEGELFKLRTATDIVHVPYKGTMPSLTATIAGEVELTFCSLPSAIPFVKAGRLRALAIAGTQRSALLPDVPTMKESGIEGVEASIWYGMFAPAGTPADVVEVLARAIEVASRSPDYRQRLLDIGAEPFTTSPEAFGRQLRDEVARWSSVIKDAGIRPE